MDDQNKKFSSASAALAARRAGSAIDRNAIEVDQDDQSATLKPNPSRVFGEEVEVASAGDSQKLYTATYLTAGDKSSTAMLTINGKTVVLTPILNVLELTDPVVIEAMEEAMSNPASTALRSRFVKATPQQAEQLRELQRLKPVKDQATSGAITTPFIRAVDLNLRDRQIDLLDGVVAANLARDIADRAAAATRI